MTNTTTYCDSHRRVTVNPDVVGSDPLHDRNLIKDFHQRPLETSVEINEIKLHHHNDVIQTWLTKTGLNAEKQ